MSMNVKYEQLSQEEILVEMNKLKEQLAILEELYTTKVDPIKDKRSIEEKAFEPLSNTMVCIEDRYYDDKDKRVTNTDEDGNVIGYNPSGHNLFHCGKCNNYVFSYANGCVNQNNHKCICSVIQNESFFSKYCSKTINDLGYNILRQHSIKIDGKECSYDYVLRKDEVTDELNKDGEYIFVEILDNNHLNSTKKLKDTKLIKHVMDNYPKSKLLYIDLQHIDFEKQLETANSLKEKIVEIVNGKSVMNLVFDVYDRYTHLVGLENKAVYNSRVKILEGKKK